MRRTCRKNEFDSITKSTIIFGLIFIISVAIGTCLNKVIQQNNIHNFINPAINYYNSDIDILHTVFSNLKLDLAYLAIFAISGIFIITTPINIIVFILKGLSIGYTINTLLLTLKLKSINLIVLVLLKNILVVPCSILLLLIIVNYHREILSRINKTSNANVYSLFKRYICNVVIIIFICSVLQIGLNSIGICVMKFLAG